MKDFEENPMEFTANCINFQAMVRETKSWDDKFAHVPQAAKLNYDDSRMGSRPQAKLVAEKEARNEKARAKRMVSKQN